MPKQFDVYRPDEGLYVLVLQNDALDDLNTRVICRLVAEDWSEHPIRGLNPTLHFGDLTLRLNPLQMTTIRCANLGVMIGSAAHRRDDIFRACDMLLRGY